MPPKETRWDYLKDVFGRLYAVLAVISTFLTIAQIVLLSVEGPWTGKNWPIRVEPAVFLCIAIGIALWGVIEGGYRRDRKRAAEIADLESWSCPGSVDG